jgi:hypothetical protein
MTKAQNTKPEPAKAKNKWHYDSYFLSQIQRLYPAITHHPDIIVDEVNDTTPYTENH